MLAALIGGWLLVREKILNLYGVCKDLEYLICYQRFEAHAPLVQSLRYDCLAD